MLIQINKIFFALDSINYSICEFSIGSDKVLNPNTRKINLPIYKFTLINNKMILSKTQSISSEYITNMWYFIKPNNQICIINLGSYTYDDMISKINLFGWTNFTQINLIKYLI